MMLIERSGVLGGSPFWFILLEVCVMRCIYSLFFQPERSVLVPFSFDTFMPYFITSAALLHNCDELCKGEN